MRGAWHLLFLVTGCGVPLPPPQPTALTIADVDGDSHADLVVGGEAFPSMDGRGYVQVLLGRGDGTFQPPIPTDAGVVEDVAVADFDRDGALDLAVSGYGLAAGSTDQHTEGLFTFLDAGAAQFKTPTSVPLAQTAVLAPGPIAAVDVNGDSALDVVMPAGHDDTGDSQVAIFMNQGRGQMAMPFRHALDVGGTHPAGEWSLLPSDLDGDHWIDLVVGNSNGRPLAILINRGGTLHETSADLGGQSCQGLGAGDLDGDGRTDVVALLAPDLYSDASVGVLLGRGDGTLAPPTVYPCGARGAGLAVRDVNLDGRPDVVVALQEPANAVAVLLGRADGTLQRPLLSGPRCQGPDCGWAWDRQRVVVGLFDGDPFPDLAILASDPAAAGQATVKILRGGGDGNFGAPQRVFP